MKQATRGKKQTGGPRSEKCFFANIRKQKTQKKINRGNERKLSTQKSPTARIGRSRTSWRKVAREGGSLDSCEKKEKKLGSGMKVGHQLEEVFYLSGPGCEKKKRVEG